MKTSKKIKIYTLIYQGQIVYVGQTTMKYLSSRKSSGYGNTVPFYKECTIHLIEETDDVSRERYWIEKLKKEGHPLLNKEAGASGLDKKEYQKEYRMEYLKEYQNRNKDKIKSYKTSWQREYRQKKKALENEKY